MSALTIEESFEATASKERVYAFLRDPEQCFPCLPGATFGTLHPDGKFDGKIAVAVGPVRVSYDGWATYDEDNPEAGRLVLSGEGRETGGAGIVKMDMTCTITETDGVSRVEVVAEVGLAGKIIRFGRGLVRGIAAQVFQDFTARALAQLEGGASETPAATATADPFGGATADPFASEAPAASGAADPFASTPAAEVDPFAPEPATPEPGAPAAPPTPPAEPAPSSSAPPPPAPASSPAPPAAPDNAPANGLALLFRAIWSMIRSWFGGRS